MASGLDALLGLGDDDDEGARRVAAGGAGDVSPETPGHGRGPSVDVPAPDGLLSLAVAAIRPNAYQPRIDFADGELDELAASIVEVGVLQPVIVRRVEAGRYELVAGERRWRAAQRAGLREVPAIVRALDDRGSLEQAVVENLHRSDLNVLEEAAAYRQLMDEFALTQDEVARRVGKSRSAVANLVRLLQLPGSVQRLIRTGELSGGHARALLALGDPEVQASLAARVVRDGLSVRDVEGMVRDADREQTAPQRGGRPPSRSKAPSLLEIEDLLADRLDTRVEVSLSGSRGRIVIEFADLDDLDRVYQEMVGGGRGPTEGGGGYDSIAGRGERE